MIEAGKVDRGTNTKYGVGLFVLGLELGHWPPDQVEPPGPALPIEYSFVDEETLRRLEKVGVPVRSPFPFACDWSALEVRFQGRSSHLGAWLADLVYQEWTIYQWMRGFPAPIVDHLSLKNLWIQAAGQRFPDDRVEHGVHSLDFPAKWLLDILSHRIVAVWNKIPAAVCRVIPPHVDFVAMVSQGARVERMRNAKAAMQLDDRQAALFDRLIDQADEAKAGEQFKYVRRLRNGDLHNNTEGFGSLFGTQETRRQLHEAYDNVLPEVSRAREGIMASIALMLGA